MVWRRECSILNSFVTCRIGACPTEAFEVWILFGEAMGPLSPLRILLVDDQEPVRRGLRSLLSSRTDWLVCGEAADGLEAVEKAKTLRPNVVLMDISMPRMDGVEATRIIRQEVPESQVIIISQNDAAIVSRQAREADAAAYVAKVDLSRDLLPIIDRVIGHRNTARTLDSKEAELTLSGSGDVPMPEAAELEAEVEKRFGLLPNFFRLAAETPEITAKLWGFAQAAYLDIPFPSLFKERLFVHLSRFCEVRYCIARHVGFLAGLGHPSGDAKSPVQTVEEIIRLLRRPFPRGQNLEPWFSLCAASHAPLGELPSADSDMEEAIFASAGHVFLQTPDAPPCRDALMGILGRTRLQHLIVFLAFVRTAHYWTKVHRELTFEEDIKQLLATHEALAECIFNDPEGASDKVSQTLLDELASLRSRAGRETNLLAAIVDSSDDAIISKSLDGVITSWNQSAERLFGYTAEEAVGKHISLIIPTVRSAEEAKIIERLKRGERILHFETVRRRKDGMELDISLSVSPVKDAEGRVVGASKVARDISERQQAERALRESKERLRTLADGLETQVRVRTQELEQRNAEVLQQSEQLRELSNRLLQSQDDERRRIARELHDSAGQIVTALGMNLGSITHHVGQDPLLGKAVEESRELVQQLSKEIRTMSYLLHPPLLDENGLSEAIRWYMQGLMERSGLRIELNISENFGRLPSEIELAAFRIVQECLTNIHRHSGSKTAMIRLSRTAESVSVHIQDEGNGISAEKLAGIQSQRSGVGITGMRERVRHFRGVMDIQSNGKGTKIAVTFPVPKTATSELQGALQQTRAAG